MATENGWAEPPMAREQMILFSPSLDDVIPANHEVRLLDETLRALDWSDWEALYKRQRGQPPLHPRVLAGLWLYGMIRRIKTSRPLEYACAHNIDFMWLAEGEKPDHSTLAAFFSKHTKQLKDLFKQVCRLAMEMGLVRLGEVGFDGTRVKAANSRYRTLTKPTLEKRLAGLNEQIDNIMEEAIAGNEAESAYPSEKGTQLPESLQTLQERRQKLEEALTCAQARDEQRRREGGNPTKHPCQVPMTDKEARVMPNKEGGYAPNYTPTALTDGASGIVLDAEVTNTTTEQQEALPAVDRVQESSGKRPECFLSDGGNASGSILEGLDQRGITAVVPVKSSEPAADSAVRRKDLSQPVSKEQWDALPRNPKGHLDKSCFMYEAKSDQYYCPMGRVLRYRDRETRKGVRMRRYRSDSCAGCPLASECLHPNSSKNGTRSIRRDEYTELREQTATRMKEPKYAEMFNRRSAIAETPFGWIKGVLGLRQFRHVGLEKVAQEWRWACLTLNVKKILSAVAQGRCCPA